LNVPQAADARIGQVVADRYRLQRKLGGGSMGDVYEAVHTFTRKHVAIKLLHPSVGNDANAAGRFLREARAASEIGHPAIVDVLDAGQDAKGTFYLVLTLLEGEDLSQAIQRGDLTQPEIVEIGIQMLEGLSAAHARGIVHRDIKPENIFLARNEKGELRVKILDFGIAKPLDPALRLAETQKGVIIGTPFYMSPEQALGDAVDHRADLWSAGAVLYHALTRHPPFDAETYTKLAMAIIGTGHRRLPDIVPSCPSWLSTVIDRALAKKPADRWQSATQMAEALRARGAGPRLSLDWAEEENRTIRTPSPFEESRDSLEPPPVFSASRPGRGQFDEQSKSSSSGEIVVELAPFPPDPPKPPGQPGSSPAIFAPPPSPPGAAPSAQPVSPPYAAPQAPWPAPQPAPPPATRSTNVLLLVAILVGGTLVAVLLAAILAALVT
jgi:serine/threonine-protein kinase